MAGVNRRYGVPQPHFRTACRGQAALQCTTELRPRHPPQSPVSFTRCIFCVILCAVSACFHFSQVSADIRFLITSEALSALQLNRPCINYSRVKFGWRLLFKVTLKMGSRTKIWFVHQYFSVTYY